MSYCPGYSRHWFSAWGTTHVPTPVCTRCGEPRPGPLSEDEWASLRELAERYPPGSRGDVGQHVRRALEDGPDLYGARR